MELEVKLLFDADDDAETLPWKANGALVMCWLVDVGVELSLLYGG